MRRFAVLAGGALLLCGCDRPPAEPSQPTASATTSGHRTIIEPADQPTGPMFTDITNETGIDFRFYTGASGRLFLPEITAGGLAVFDADGDGLPDIYALNGSSGLPDDLDPDTADAPTNRFFRNHGSLRFTDDTDRSGLRCAAYAFGVAVGDIDNDGDLDLFVSNLGPDRLFRNRGDGTFQDISEESDLDRTGWGTSSVFFDFNRTGSLDLAVARYVEFLPKRCAGFSGRPDYCGPKEFPPVHDLLFLGDGEGTFADISESAGLTEVRAAGLGIVADDFDDDGWMDLYVANDGYANQLWINREGRTMSDLAMRLGCALNMFGQAEAGMGVVAADFNDNGRIDLFMTHLLNESNTLYINHGGRRGFSDTTAGAGLDATSMAFTGFGVVAFDADHDGTLDIFIANGRVYAETPSTLNVMPEPWSVYAEPNLLYRGTGEGRFELVAGQESGLGTSAEISRGAVAADLNGDGRLELIVCNIEAPLRIYRNTRTPEGNHLTVRAIDPDLNRDALGARITLTFEGEQRSRTLQTGGGYLTAAPPEVHFGLGHRQRVERIDVRWPNGSHEVFPESEVNQTVTLRRGQGRREES